MSTLIPDKILGPHIRLNNVSLKDTELTILDESKGNFEAGLWHAILGPNGGGKSSLIKTILGLTKHNGEVIIEWLVSQENSKSKPGNIGYLPQPSPFDSSLPVSVRDFLLLNLSIKPIWFARRLPKQIYIALDQVGLGGKLDRKLGDLSGGERQKLMLCIALLKKPSLLILDEPMTGLDQQSQEVCLTLLSEFHQAGGTLLMIEHDWEVVKKHCQQIHWVDKALFPHQSCHDFFRSLNSHQHTAKTTGIPIHRHKTLQPS